MYAMARVILLLMLIATASLSAHEMRLEVGVDTASVITLSYPDGEPFADKPYQLFAEGSESPRQSGQTDTQGRVIFVPGRLRQWRLRAFSEEGHGTDTLLELETGSTANLSQDKAAVPFPYLILGVGVLLSGFGLLMLYARRGKQ